MKVVMEPIIGGLKSSLEILVKAAALDTGDKYFLDYYVGRGVIKGGADFGCKYIGRLII